MQALPIRIPAIYFKQVQSVFTEFIWARKRPRLAKKILILPKPHGGMALPDIRTYYYATHLSRLVDWCRHYKTKLWTQLEQAQSGVPLSRAPPQIKRHPLIGTTARISARLMSKASLSTQNSPLRPILGNPQFAPGLNDGIFRGLNGAGLYQASHFSSGGKWKSFSELTDPTGPFRLDFLRSYHFLHTMEPPPANDQPLTILEELCADEGVLPHTLSLTYKLLITPPADSAPPGLLKWESELDRQFVISTRNQILRFTHKSSICAKTQETNYKIISRWYRTLVVLHKLYPTTSDQCWRCQSNKGTLLHIFWTCPKLTHFWQTV